MLNRLLLVKIKPIVKSFLLFIFLLIANFCICQSGDCIGCDQDKESVETLTFNNQANPKISIFPNPTNHYINIEDSSNAVKELKLFSLLGKNIKNFEVNGATRFNIMDMPKGLYLLQIVDHQGALIKTIRVRKV